MTAPVDNGQPHRQFSNYDNENGGRISVHVVTEETQGTVQTHDGTARTVVPGDVLIESGRPGVYFVGGSDSLEGYSEASDDDEGSQARVTDVSGADVEDETVNDRNSKTGEYDPSEYTAAEVRSYLETQKEQGNRDEFNRVVTAEQNGKNRSSALVEYDR